MCLHMLAHWRLLANTTELVLSSAHPSPQSKRQIDWFGRSGTAYSNTAEMGSSFPQIAPSNGVPGPPNNTWFPGPT